MRTERDPARLQAHWAAVYATKSPEAVSWFQPEPALSLELVRRAKAPPAWVLDVGGGASFLADRLVLRGYRVAVLDVAQEALQLVQRRLGEMAEVVEWFVADVTRFEPPHLWDIWHDRAVFHFLTRAEERAAYREVLAAATAPGSHAVIATFAPNGPVRCSGLPTLRYSPQQLHAELGDAWTLADTEWEAHRTPAGAIQQFLYCRFIRQE